MMVSRPLPLPVSAPAITFNHLQMGNRENVAFPNNARAGPSRPQVPMRPKFTRVNFRTQSAVDADAPKKALKRRSNVTVEIPVGRRRKDYLKNLVLPPLLPVRETDIVHYARHQAKVVGPLCGLRGCTHRLADSESKTLRKHFTDHHLVAHRPFLDEDELGAKARPPPAKFLAPPPPLPNGVLPYNLIALPVVASPILRPFYRQKPADKYSTPTIPCAEHPIHPNYSGHFWPTGDSITGSDLSRESSYICSRPHIPEEDDPAEKALHDELGAMPDSLAISSMPIVAFPESRSASASSSRTAVSLFVSTEKSPSSFQIVPRQHTGRLPMTIPLADVHAQLRQRPTATPPPTHNIYDRKRKAYGPPGHSSQRLRRIAEKVATWITGRTIGLDWWETMFGVERSMEEAVTAVAEEE